jgi:predicted P-loop ATPase
MDIKDMSTIHGTIMPSRSNLDVEQPPIKRFGLPVDTLRNIKTGKLPNTLHTICEILRQEYKGRLTYNEMTKTHCLDKEPVNTDQITAIREEIECKFEIAPGQQNMLAAFNRVAYENKFHPVQGYLQSLPPWDGVRRWEQLPQKVLFSKGKLDALYLRKWGIGAVARVVQPGCKLDTLLNLCGNQGLGKSSFFRVLAGDKFFGDAEVDIGSKESIQVLHRVWIHELGELETITGKKEVGAIKQWLAKRDDDYRPPYAIKNEIWLRQFIVVGTTNKIEFLVDIENRRFWVIEVEKVIDLELLAQWCDQLWAEALFYYQQGESWWLTNEQEREQKALNNAYEDQDPWFEVIESWLKKQPKPQHTLNEILVGALQLSAKETDKRHKNRVADIMRKLGWEYKLSRIEGNRARVFKPITVTHLDSSHNPCVTELTN